MNRFRGWAVLLPLCAALTACSQAPEPSFVLTDASTDIESVELKKLGKTGNPIALALEDKFGTPNNLVVWEAFNIDYGRADPDARRPELRKAGWKLKHGRDMYMRWCLHCHGVSGDGNGPTAQFMTPRPRDYRAGEFKFTSTRFGIRASRSDLRTILENGIPGTSMPSFVLLNQPDKVDSNGLPVEESEDIDELASLVEYIRFLAMRGEMERGLLGELPAGGSAKENAKEVADLTGNERAAKLAELRKDFSDELNANYDEILASAAEIVAGRWLAAEDPANIVNPRVATVRALAKGKPLAFKDLPPNREDAIELEPGTRVWLTRADGNYWSAGKIKVDEKGIESLDGEANGVGFIALDHLEARTGIDPQTSTPTRESAERGRLLYFGDKAKCVDCHGYSGRGNGRQTEDFQPVKGATPARNYAVKGLHDDWGNPVQPRNLTRGVFRGGRRPIDLYRRVSEGIKGTPMAGFNAALTDAQIWDLVNYVTTLPHDSTLGGPPPGMQLPASAPAAPVATRTETEKTPSGS